MMRGSFAVGNSAFLYRCATHDSDLLTAAILPSEPSQASLPPPNAKSLQTYKMSLLDVSTNSALYVVVTGPLDFNMLLEMVLKLQYISGGIKVPENLSFANTEHDVVTLKQRRYFLQVKAVYEGGTHTLHMKVSEEDDRKEKPISRRLSMVSP